MKKILFFLVCFFSLQTTAQEKMRITMNDGTPLEFNIRFIDEMTFYTPQPVNIIGEWVNYSDEMGGTIQCFGFKEDGTVVYKMFYSKYQISSEYTGTYSLNNKVVELKILGSIISLSIDSYTENDFYSNGSGTYYRVQEPVYSMNTADTPISIGNEGDIVKYVDGCIVVLEDNKIKALKEGMGYALVEEAESGAIKAYSIEVNPSIDEYINFTQYFKKTINQIENTLGEKHQTNLEKHTITYTNFSSSILSVTFTFSDNMESKPTSEVISVSLFFYDENKMQSYSDSIANNYILDSGASTDTRKTYYDADNSSTASVKIVINTTLSMITYTDMKQTPASVVDWTQYFKKSGDQIKAKFGSSPDITNDDEYEDYTMVYYNASPYKYISFSFNKGFEKVTSIRVAFNDASSMKDYCDAIAGKYILYSETETRKTYYDTDKPSTASVRIAIQSSGSTNYITYTDYE